jgi:hypothetical protein
MKRISFRDVLAVEDKPELQEPATKLDKTWDGMNIHEKLPDHLKSNKNKVHNLTNKNKVKP